MSKFIDIGVNLTNKSLMQNIDAVLQRAAEVGVKQMVVTGTSLEESQAAIELCHLYPRDLFCTAGMHPHHASDWNEDSLSQLAILAGEDAVRAVGETGLDFNRDFSPRDRQLEVFHQQLELACDVGKPVFTHQRDAHDSFVAILREYRTALQPIVVHCFTDNRAALREYLDLDCHIGVTGWICDERRGVELQEMVKYIPADRLMLETDAPYLLPRDLDPKPRSRINEPCNLPHIARSVAHYQNKDMALLAAECLQTTRQFFNI